MKKSIGGSFNERRASAAETKKKLLEQYKSATKADNPERLARIAEREAIAVARVARKEAKAQQIKQDAADAAARELAEAEERAAELKRQGDQAVAEEAERKAERDRRYAARKNRKR